MSSTKRRTRTRWVYEEHTKKAFYGVKIHVLRVSIWDAGLLDMICSSIHLITGHEIREKDFWLGVWFLDSVDCENSSSELL